MKDKPRVPEPETSKRLLANLRVTHREIELFNLELAEINARLEYDILKKRLTRSRSYSGRNS